MRYAEDVYCTLFVIDLVERPIVTCSNPPLPFETGQHLGSTVTWIGFKLVESSEDTGMRWLGQFSEVPLGRRLQEDSVQRISRPRGGGS